MFDEITEAAIGVLQDDRASISGNLKLTCRPIYKLMR